MKRVSFKVAQAIKEAGYPQEGDWWYSKDGKLSDWLMPHQQEIYAPTYLDVWLWLWREKGIQITIGVDFCCIWVPDKEVNYMSKTTIKNNDPEEAIIAAIEYLVNNDLIK